ncbi:MAG: hypothetical protein A2161_16440 [Candidatus Schekmanbacteria bacterium RBG_13_48_7]|uniref:DUF5666 domain-containing protein n=1 Tax=Candidatus Schekmanbacteria bacterium RBG_13_48_7 TaxID=1817878 RepID=A0A1F7RWP3_9BACT|nr:MAG: hypothetical protein A2161_16440 [Candidatus Schekmanbacteria bacterium RBG_13_48_7]
MKKLMIIFIGLLFLGVSIAYTEEQTTTNTAAQQIETKVTENIKYFTGKIESVTLGDLTAGTKTEIIVMDQKNQKMTFVVTDITKFVDSMGKAALIEIFKKGETVKIKYIVTPESVNLAHQVKLVK